MISDRDLWQAALLMVKLLEDHLAELLSAKPLSSAISASRVATSPAPSSHRKKTA